MSTPRSTSRTFAFQQVDVFSPVPLKGNPLAVVVGADALDDMQMAAFARWTNLSETTFLLQPTTPAADYRVRIFTPERELPFAGHPTLGSCHVWLASGGAARDGRVVQECGAGLVTLRADGDRLAFAAPPLRRSGAVEPAVLAQIARSLGLSASTIRASQWVDNGPGWVAVMLATRAEVLALKPDYAVLDGLELGVVAPWSPQHDGMEAQFEVRAFVSQLGWREDPVTGSLNAGLAQWLIGAGLAPRHYVAAQGTCLGRAGRVHVDTDGDTIWVGGHTVTCVRGELNL
jgi:PhzF family phenazine biosynthesis protein